MPTQRQLRVGENIRHALAAVLERGDVPWPVPFLNAGKTPIISITEVQISPDLQNATAFVMPLGGVRLKETVKAMNEIVGFFRHEVAREVELRYVPKIYFKPDESFDYATKIDTILHDPAVAKDLAKEEDDD